jgi:exonuclease SbcC
MSYPAGCPDIDFSAFDVVCLSGDNGHGKSALLDAMTWALWGQARAHSDDLLRIGEQNMSVAFEFEIEDIRYQVVRQRSRARQGSTHTELQIVDSGGVARSQTGQGERATQDKINHILRMDYETFISSAFLLQGRADEFTRQKPTDRKDVLARILALDRYDELEAMARERARGAAGRAELLVREVEDLRREAGMRPDYEQSLARSQKALAEAADVLSKQEQEISGLQAQLSALEAKLALLGALVEQEQQCLGSAARAAEQATEAANRLAEVDAFLSRRQEIEEGRRALDEVRARLQSLETAQQAYLEAQRCEQALEKKLAEARRVLSLQAGKAHERLRSLEQQAATAARLEASISSLAATHPSSAELEQKLEGLRGEHEILAVHRQSCKTGVERAHKDIIQVEQRLNLLQEEAAACPLCEQPLGPHGHERLRKKLEQERLAIQEQIRQLETDDTRAAKDDKSVIARGQETRRQMDAARKAEQEIARLQGELSQARAAAHEIAEARSEMDRLQSVLDGDPAPEITTRLQDARRAMDAARYNASDHQQARAHERQLQPTAEAYERLQTMSEWRLQLEAQLATARQLHSAEEARARQLQERQRPLKGLAAEKRGLDSRIAELSALRQRLTQQAAQARQDVGRWETLLEQCDAKERLAKQKHSELITANKESAIYRELTLAFSKKGIQAMIIENVVPEVEEEANRLLARMTDNGMHIQFRTQKELKKGGGAETLDIVIGDDMGDRPYECYSGGEAFRINFAIRIALSRLLAKRAGARLQTIVIDEGFGTQDAAGRRRLVEAIQSVREEFSRILVITHMDELKDEFPHRLHITKDDRGSRVDVLT